MKAALIGTSRQAGSRILAELVSRGHRVTAIARYLDKIAEWREVTRVKGDVRDPDGLADLLRGHNAIINSARFSTAHSDLTNAVKKSGVPRYIVSN